MLSLSELATAIAALVFMLFLYVTLSIALILGAVVFIGCIWPKDLVKIIELNASPDSFIAWWVKKIQEFGPSGWSLQLNPTDGLYMSCVKDQWWDLLILTSWFVFILTIGILFMYLIGILFSIFVRKTL